MKSRRRAKYGLEALEQRTLLSAQLVSDINTAPGSSEPSNPVQANGLTFFVADDGLHGREVWRTDGTAAGTFIVKDVAPGPESSSPILLGAAGDTVYFETVLGRFWATDGGTNTREVASGLVPGATLPVALDRSASLGDVLYFASYSQVYSISSDGVEWVTDLPGSVTQMATVGSSILILTNNSLWVSDGTMAGTVQLKALGGSSSDKFAMTELGGTVYFTARNAQTSVGELWETQGTSASTSLAASLQGALPVGLTGVGQGLFYLTLGNADETVWHFDTGTQQATKLKTVSGFPIVSFPTCRSFGSKFFFSDCSFNTNLWVSDGTTAGTMLLKDHATGYAGLPSMIDARGALLFQASDPAGGRELWKTDGTVANTVRVADLVPGTTSSTPGFLGAAGGKIVLSATDPEHGREPWVTDGTEEGTGLLIDLYVGTAGSHARTPVGVNGRVVFLDDGSGGGPLHVITDLKTGETTPLTFGAGGPAPVGTVELVRAGGLVYFDSTGPTGTEYLCVTDGTPEGTRKVVSLPSGMYGRFVQGERFYFMCGSVLYTSDGTEAGTVTLMTMPAGSQFVPQTAFFNGQAYFYNSAGTTTELRKTDGTPQGTSLVGSIKNNSFGLRYLTVLGGWLYFLDGSGYLNQTDGTTIVRTQGVDGQYTYLAALGDRLLLQSTTSLLTSFRPGDGDIEALADVAYLTTAVVPTGKWGYFAGAENGHRQVWRTDGTAAGTTVVFTGVYPDQLTVVGDLVYFIDSAEGHGREVWATSGVPGGTYLVADLAPGDGSPAPYGLTEAAGVAYFGANDGVHGSELFRAVDDVAPKVVSSKFDYAGHPAGVTVAFSERVVGLSVAHWTLTDRATGRDVSSWIASYAFDADLDVARVTFAAGLPDGDYRLGLAAGVAADSAGNRSGEGLAFDFFQLAGDVNRDRAVDFKDLVIVAQNYNTTGKMWGTGDVTGDGAVDFNDLVVLAQRYNTGLGAVPVAPGPVGAVSVAAEPVASVVKSEGKGRKVFSETPVVARKVAARRAVVRRRR